MGTLVLGVGEYGTVANPGEVIKTFALGSCVAVVVMDRRTRVVGMLHVALPSSKTNLERAKTDPGYFADTGIPELLEKMVEAGTQRGDKDLIVKLAGGAKVLDVGNKFDVGKKNQLAVKKALWAHGLTPRAEDLGGGISRTVEVDIDKGRTVISTSQREPWEI